jgi:hypothetical protein
MNVTNHVRDVALLRALQLHRLSRPSDRVLLQDLAATWKREIGLRHGDLLEVVNRMSLDGVLAHRMTLSGAALELTERGARDLEFGIPAIATTLPAQLFARLVSGWNTMFVLSRARRRTRQRLRLDAVPLPL